MDYRSRALQIVRLTFYGITNSEVPPIHHKLPSWWNEFSLAVVEVKALFKILPLNALDLTSEAESFATR